MGGAVCTLQGSDEEMKKEVNLCDNCESSLSEARCASCGKDVCRRCAYSLRIAITRTGAVPLNISRASYTPKSGGKFAMICKPCYRKVFDGGNMAEMEKLKQITEEIVEIVRNHAVAEVV